MKWRVWITGYPDSYSDVEADNCDEAMTKGVRDQKASHTGEVYEINAQRRAHPDFTPGRNTELTFHCLARISRDGAITFEV